MLSAALTLDPPALFGWNSYSVHGNPEYTSGLIRFSKTHCETPQFYLKRSGLGSELFYIQPAVHLEQGYNACLKLGHRLMIDICELNIDELLWKVERGHLVTKADPHICLSRDHTVISRNTALLRGCTPDESSYTAMTWTVYPVDFILPEEETENLKAQYKPLDTVHLFGEVTQRCIQQSWTLSAEHLFEFSILIPGHVGWSHRVCFTNYDRTTLTLNEPLCIPIAGLGHSSSSLLESESESGRN